MLKPQSQRTSRMQSVTEPQPTIAPIGGWNARDALGDMDVKDAVILDNFFPGSTDVSLRKGSLRYAYGIGRISAFTRASSATYFDVFNVLTTAGNDVPRFAQISPYTWMNPPPLIVEAAATNYLLYSRDFTNAAWVKSNATVLKDQLGLDGAANAASSVASTAANATVLQAVTMPTGGVLTGYVKRISGTGDFSVTVNNGGAYTIVTGITTSAWTKFTLAGALINPTVGFKLTTSGDKFIFDLGQAEVGAVGTSYIPTTSASANRSADNPTYLSGASATAVTKPVETLVEYAAGTVRKLRAACNGAYYDISGGGVVGVPLASGFTSNRWQYINQAGYACLYNGYDTPQLDNGTTLTAAVITGPATPANLIYPCTYSGRLFAVERGTMNIWYSIIGGVQGAFSKLDFSSFFKHGGQLIACGTWSRDGGSGANDYIVFMTDQGEVLVYNGDPSLAASWTKVGLWRCAPPIGIRPMVKMAQDLVVITSTGYLPLSMVLPTDRFGDAKFALSDKIRNAVTQNYIAYKGNFGWEALVYPKGNMVIFNIPTSEDVSAEQHIANTTTGSWCRFLNLPAITWALYTENLYFGAPNGYVVQADTGQGDDPLTSYTLTQTLAAITWDVLTAFNYFKRKDQQKNFKMVRPVLGSSGKPTLSIALCVDFEVKNPTQQITIGGGGSQWDVAMWDVSLWDSGLQIRKSWINAPGTGYCAALRLRGATTGLTVVLYSIDYAYEPGGIL